MIDLFEVRKAYGRATAVAGVTLQIPRGQIFGLLGPNGAGKSTLIRLMTGLTIPDAGHRRIDGLDVSSRSPSVKQRFGVVPQYSSLDVVVGLVTKSHEDTATYNNFFITPMAFFGGTFFPPESLPPLVRPLIQLIPLTHATRLLWASALEGAAAVSAMLLLLTATALFIIGAQMIARYSE